MTVMFNCSLKALPLFFLNFSIHQDKKGISGKPIPTERRTIYQRHIRPSTMLAKSILEGNEAADLIKKMHV